MEWITRHQRKLWVLEGLALLTAAGVLAHARSNDSFTLQPAQLGFMVLPWVVAFAAAMPLIYLSWFRRPPSSRFVAALMKMLFFAFTGGGVLILVAFYGTFVFGAA
jgi:hypothetical protein